MTTRTPSEATARASSGACRSGRNTTAYSSAPSSAASAEGDERCRDEAEECPEAYLVGRPGMRTSSLPLRSDAYVYAVNKAIVPVAKFTTPELR